MKPIKRFEFKNLSQKQKTLEELPPPPLAFSEEELAEATRKAHDEGYQKGRAEAIDETTRAQNLLDQDIRQVAERIALQLLDFHEQTQNLLAQKKEEVIHLSGAIAKKIAGEALKNDPIEKLAPLVEKTITRLLGEKMITVTVHETMTARLQEKLQPMLAEKNLEQQVVVRGVASLPSEDCRITWESGAAELSHKEVWAEVEKMLEDIVKG